MARCCKGDVGDRGRQGQPGKSGPAFPFEPLVVFGAFYVATGSDRNRPNLLAPNGSVAVQGGYNSNPLAPTVTPTPDFVYVALEPTSKVDITTLVAHYEPVTPGNVTRVTVSYASSWALLDVTVAFVVDMASPIDSRANLDLPLQPGHLFWVQVVPLIPDQITNQFNGMNVECFLHN